jgi:phosphoenolpyruvate carboxykinase (GTP)
MIQSVMTKGDFSHAFGISINEIKPNENRTTLQATSKALTKNEGLLNWVEEMAALTQPDAIHWVDGSQEEYDALCAQMVESGTFIKLNQDLWPGCYYAKSDPGDVARVEDRTYICSLSKQSAGPTNNWVDPSEMRHKLKTLFDGCMRGRTMYVLAFSMGPVGSPMSQIGVQLTDSPYAVVNMRIMARIRSAGFKPNRCELEAVRALRALSGCAARSGSERRSMAMQSR